MIKGTICATRCAIVKIGPLTPKIMQGVSVPFGMRRQKSTYHTKYLSKLLLFWCCVLLLGGELETVSPAHTALLNQCIKKIKDTGSRLSGDHKELHGMVSKVGKAIDKVLLLWSVVILSHSAYKRTNMLQTHVLFKSIQLVHVHFNGHFTGWPVSC